MSINLGCNQICNSVTLKRKRGNDSRYFPLVASVDNFTTHSVWCASLAVAKQPDPHLHLRDEQQQQQIPTEEQKASFLRRLHDFAAGLKLANSPLVTDDDVEDMDLEDAIETILTAAAASSQFYERDGREKRSPDDTDNGFVKTQPSRPANNGKLGSFLPSPDLADSLLGSLGSREPPRNMEVHSVANNVGFMKVGRTSPTVGYANLRLDVNLKPAYDTVDSMISGVQHAQRWIKSPFLEAALSSNDSLWPGHVSPLRRPWVKGDDSEISRWKEMSFYEDLRDAQRIRAELTGIQDMFRPLPVMQDDFEKGRSPYQAWMGDARIFRDKKHDKRVAWILGAAAAAGVVGGGITSALWSLFSPEEAAATAQHAILAEAALQNIDDIGKTFDILNELHERQVVLARHVKSNSELIATRAVMSSAKASLEREINAIRQLLDSAAHGTLASVAMSRFDLRKASDDIHRRARELKMTPLAQSFGQLLQAPVSLFRKGRGFEIIIHIPLVPLTDNGEMDQMTIFKFSDLPIALNKDLQVRVAPGRPKFLVVSPKTRHWRTMSYEELSECTKMGTFFVCPLNGVMRRPLPDERGSKLSDADCLYHLFSGQFKGASSACNAEVSLIDLHLMQVGPYDFTGVSSSGNPVLGEMKCPHSDDFVGSIMINNLTSFSLPPSCRIVFPNHVAYASDRSFIRSAAGVEFRHPYPPSVIAGNMSGTDVARLTNSVGIIGQLLDQSRTSQWQSRRRAALIQKLTQERDNIQVGALGLLSLMIITITAVGGFCMLRLNRRLRMVEGRSIRLFQVRREEEGRSYNIGPRRGEQQQQSIPLLSMDLPEPPPPPPPPQQTTDNRTTIIRDGKVSEHGQPAPTSPPPPAYPRV